MASSTWCLEESARAFVRESAADALRGIRFHLLRSAGASGGAGDEDGRAEKLERSAHSSASVMATTTTGARPHHEGVQAYARKAAELLLGALKEEGTVQTVAEGCETRLDLSSDGNREFLTAETAADALEPLMKGKAVKAVCFSTKSFGVDAATVAAEALEAAANSLVVADLSDVIAGRPEDEALQALQILCSGIAKTRVTNLDLSDNALGEKGVRACAAAVQMSSLEFVSFQNDGISVHAARALNELMGANAAHLKGLRLYNNMSDDDGALAIADLLSRAPKLEEFRMASSRVKEAGCEALSAVLSACSSLKSLDLSDNPFGDDAGSLLAASVRSKDHLLKVAFNDLCLGDEALIELFQALRESAPLLETLELGGNEMTPRAAGALSVVISEKTHLKVLSIPENELRNQGGHRIAVGLPPSIERIDMKECMLGYDGAVAIAQASSKGCEKLLEVNLDINLISEEGVELITEMLGDKLILDVEENDPEGYDDEEDEDDDEPVEGMADKLAQLLDKVL